MRREQKRSNGSSLAGDLVKVGLGLAAGALLFWAGNTVSKEMAAEKAEEFDKEKSLKQARAEYYGQ